MAKRYPLDEQTVKLLAKYTRASEEMIRSRSSIIATIEILLRGTVPPPAERFDVHRGAAIRNALKQRDDYQVALQRRESQLPPVPRPRAEQDPVGQFLAGMEVTGVANRDAFVDLDERALHTIRPTDNCQVVHLFTSEWGQSVPFVKEGTAVAFQIDPTGNRIPRWNGTPVHAVARTLCAERRLLPLTALIETADWRSHDPEVAYPQAGSFIRWLIDSHGLPRLRVLFDTAPQDASSLRATFAVAYGFTLEDAEQEWLLMLEHRVANHVLGT
jgi:hypothetical protein